MTEAARGFPWDDAMVLGLGVLRLSPADFWAMTPRELAAASRAGRGTVAAAPGRTALEAMMARYPDTGKDPHE